MVFLTTGKSGTALLWTGSYAIPNGIEIGTGSSAKTVSTTGLTTAVLFRAFTVATDVTTPRFVTFTSDYTSVELSGLSIKEWGVKRSGGTLWSAEGVPATTFDGSTELQIIATWECF